MYPTIKSSKAQKHNIRVPRFGTGTKYTPYNLYTGFAVLKFLKRTFGGKNTDLIRTQLLGKNRPNQDPKSDNLD